MTLRAKIVPSMVAVFLVSTSPAEAGDLASIIPNLFGVGGITLAPPAVGFSHVPHFQVSSSQQLTSLNEALKGQLANIPLPSPASGFTFQFDPVLGTVVRSTEGFGPIYADRAETIGKGRFSLGFGYSHFDFDSLDGKNLHDGELQLTFHHDPIGEKLGLPPFFFERDTITAAIRADITADFFLFTGTYGILDNLDVSVEVPIIRIDMDVTGTAHINRIGTGAFPTLHRFPNGSDTETVHASQESTGIGDVLLRGKYKFFHETPVSMAVALDLRVPTGNEDNLQGIGSPRVRPFYIVSAGSWAGVSPHVNVGFDLGDSSSVDNQFFYKVGLDWAALKWLTFAVDILGQHILDNSRVQADGKPAGDDIVDISLGFKANVWKNVLIEANVLLPLNNTGLRADVAPFVGVEVNF